MSRSPLLLASVLVLTLSLAACAGENSDPARAAASTPVAAPTSTPSPAAAPSPSPSPTPTAQVIDVQYVDGQITGVDQRVPVKLGEQVLIRVTSDVTEEVHVHGYDLYADLVPGQTTEIGFVADLPGSYEVELHGAGRPLFQLRVS
jgi:hypothetical protein